MKKLLTQSQNKFYLIIRKVDANSNGTESETYQISKTDKLFFCPRIMDSSYKLTENEIVSKAELIIDFEQPNSDFNLYFYNLQGQMFNTVNVKKEDHEVNEKREIVVDVTSLYKTLDLKNPTSDSLNFYLTHDLESNIKFYNNEKVICAYGKIDCQRNRSIKIFN